MTEIVCYVIMVGVFLLILQCCIRLKTYKVAITAIFSMAFLGLTCNRMIERFWLSQFISEETELGIEAFNKYLDSLSVAQLETLYLSEKKNHLHGINAESWLALAILIKSDRKESQSFFEANDFPICPIASEYSPLRHFRNDMDPYSEKSFDFYFRASQVIKNELRTRK